MLKMCERNFDFGLQNKISYVLQTSLKEVRTQLLEFLIVIEPALAKYLTIS